MKTFNEMNNFQVLTLRSKVPDFPNLSMFAVNTTCGLFPFRINGSLLFRETQTIANLIKRDKLDVDRETLDFGKYITNVYDVEQTVSFNNFNEFKQSIAEYLI